ncbi:Calcium-dependent protein kinase 3 [Glycine soja]|uniref:Calcium-dependent protein kinase 3 n=1 Tax=Glycine soja TaxID=3848 RepID=A0A0B2Q6Q5_GLYSO|nr:Calcium-dependent protein kinase 3 [Glycine soja]
MREDGASDKPRSRYQRIIYESSFIFLQVIAENLSEEEIIGLKEMFKSMDTDNNGTITFEELKVGLPKLGTKVSESEVRQLMEAVYLWEFSILQLWYHRLEPTYSYINSLKVGSGLL